MSHRKPDRVAEILRKHLSIKYPEPVPQEAYKDDGTGPGRAPDGEEPVGPDYVAAMERETKARLCIVCGEREKRTRLALRCEECEEKHRKALSVAQGARK